MNEHEDPLFSQLTEDYQAALLLHDEDPSGSHLQKACDIGKRATEMGVGTLELAKIHDVALTAILPATDSANRVATSTRATFFFYETLAMIENTHRGARNEELRIAFEKLTERTKELSESNRELQEEISYRKGVEESLRASERTSNQLLEKSLQLQEDLRLLSRRLISAQEEERKRISRDLHDLIGQTLSGINLQLAALKSKAVTDTREYHKESEKNQCLLEKSVETVHQFARDLRPSLLDDLGLIPALQSHLKDFMENTGVRVNLKTFADVEKLNTTQRTVLYRVAQEACCNIAKHAKASRIDVKIHRKDKLVCMEIHDNGIGFLVGTDEFYGKKSNRLGLLGMRERVEMIGGTFLVESAPGKETTVHVKIPFLDPNPEKTPQKAET